MFFAALLNRQNKMTTESYLKVMVDFSLLKAELEWSQFLQLSALHFLQAQNTLPCVHQTMVMHLCRTIP